MNEIDLSKIELGHAYTRRELLNYFRAVWGGVSFPAKRPGFAVVVGMGYEPHFDSHDVFLLDEYESWDLRQLIRQCGALEVKYGISLSRVYRPDLSGRWIGDYKNAAASRFIDEINAEQKRDGSVEGREPLSLTRTALLEMENLYSFILPQLKDLLTAERRQLYLKGCKILSYLSEIEDAAICELELGDYPAIEALAFAVLELRDTEDQRKNSFGQQPYHYDYDPLDASNL
jgi:hypothetical protein